jgi:hypothetical protein
MIRGGGGGNKHSPQASTMVAPAKVYAFLMDELAAAADRYRQGEAVRVGGSLHLLPVPGGPPVPEEGAVTWNSR